jgi:Cap4 dsDNA endonuclease
MSPIHDTPAREVVGRETILRFQMQFQAAAYAALEILSLSGVDRVYCDYHDDFVVRHQSPEGCKYHFFQVKTKGKLNKRWTLLEIFALKKNGGINTADKIKEVQNSIAGKLFSHTIQFGEECAGVTILSNIHFADDALNAVADIRAGSSKNKYISEFIEKFSNIFSPHRDLTAQEALDAQKKFDVQPAVDYMGDSLHRFISAARLSIWRYSEIDLKPQEIDGIAHSLIELVMQKSCNRLEGISKESLDKATSVGLEDLLGILSISTSVFDTLRAGEDPAAIKSASILQRQLKQAGASESLIETASRMKVDWDVWLRTGRHIYTEFNLEILFQEIETLCTNWLLSGGKLADIKSPLKKLLTKDSIKVFVTLTEELLFGAVLAEVVRRGSR